MKLCSLWEFLGVEVFWIHILWNAGNKQKLTKYKYRFYVMPNEIYCPLQLNILTVAAQLSQKTSIHPWEAEFHKGEANQSVKCTCVFIQFTLRQIAPNTDCSNRMLTYFSDFQGSDNLLWSPCSLSVLSQVITAFYFILTEQLIMYECVDWWTYKLNLYYERMRPEHMHVRPQQLT